MGDLVSIDIFSLLTATSSGTRTKLLPVIYKATQTYYCISTHAYKHAHKHYFVRVLAFVRTHAGLNLHID